MIHTIFRNPLIVPATMGILGPMPVFAKKYEAAGGSTTDVYGPASSNGQIGGLSGQTVRVGVTAANIVDVTGVTQLRVEVVGPATSSYSLSALYVGHYNGSIPNQPYWPGYSPVQILFGGSGSQTLSAGNSYWSDWVNFTYDGTDSFLWSAYGTGTYTPYSYSGVSAYRVWRRFGNYASVNSPAGFSTYSTYSFFIKTIQVNA